jgi:type II secretion system protein L
LLNDELVWYPPGSSAGPRALCDEAECEQLAAIAEARRAPVLFAAPGGDVTLREVSFTQEEKRHIAKSLPYLLEDDFATDIEELHFAARPLGKLQVGVAACTRECMLHWEERLAEIPSANQWIPEPLLLPWQAGELCTVIEADRVVVRSGENEGFSAERELAAAMLEAIDPERCETVIVYGQEQAGDSALLPHWMQERMQWRNGSFAAALMLAEEERQPLNLRQGEYGGNLPVGLWWHQWRLAVALLAAAFILDLTATYVSYANLERENLLLRQQIEAAYRSAVPKGAVVDPEKQLQRQLQVLRGDSQSTSFMNLMDRIGRVVEEQPGAQLASVNFSDKLGEVRMNLVASDFRSVEAIRSRLAAAGLTAETENSNAQGDSVRARLRVGEK